MKQYYKNFDFWYNMYKKFWYMYKNVFPFVFHNANFEDKP